MVRAMPTKIGGFLTYSWAGQEELIRNLRKLDNILPTIIRPALRKGAMVIAKAAQRNAEEAVDTGTLRDSIGVKVWADNTQATLVAYIGPLRRRGRMVTGPRAGKSSWSKDNKRHERQGGKQRIPTRYAHFVEDRIHFMKRAMDELGDVALTMVKVHLWKGINQEVARMPKVKAISR